MSDASPTTTTANPEGVERTAQGTIVDQTPEASPATTTPAPPTQPSTTDGKTLLTEGAKPEPEKKEEPKADTKAPDKYEEYKVPEGYALDPEVKTEADKIFKGLGLNQEQAQSLVDFYTSKTSEAFQAPFKAYQEMTDAWRQESESHPDLSGKLGPGKEVSVRISKALDSLGDPKLASDFRAQMDLTGAGNHHAFIRVLDSFAKRLTEGSHVAGRGPSQAGQSRPGEAPPGAAAAMWPNLPSSRG